MNFDTAVKFLEDKELDAVLLLYIRQGNQEPAIKYIGLTEDAIDIIRKSYLNKIEKLNQKGKTFEEFDPEEYNPEAIPYLDLEKIPTDALKLKELNAKEQQAIQAEYKIFKQEEVKKIKYVLVRFSNSKGETLGIFSEYTPKTYLKSDKLLKLLFRGDFLKPLSVKHDFVLGTEIELLFFGSQIYIFKRGRFMRVFNYIATLEEHADEVFSYLKEEGNKDYKIKNIAQLKTAVAKKMGFEYFIKLNNIYVNGYYKNVPFDKIKEIKVNHELTMTIDERNKEITFTDPDEFIKLYNRDYQTDDIDGSKYVSFRKKKSKRSAPPSKA
ncbi:MAG: DUF4868 domain-containing protein [Candidatus Micrarchaeaceae archaeon]